MSPVYTSRQRKVPQRKATPLPVSPLAWRRVEQPAMLVPGVCRRTRCVLRTPLKQLRQARQRCACPSARAHPRPCASRHGQKGWERAPHGPLLRSAPTASLRLAWAGRLRPNRRQRAARVPDPRRSCEAAAEWYPLPTPSGCAEKRRSWGGRVCRRTHTLRELTCRSCLSAVRRTQRVLRHHPRSEHRRLPPFARQGEWGTQTGGRLFLAYLLLATQKKVGAPPGAHPGLRPQPRRAPSERSGTHTTNQNS